MAHVQAVRQRCAPRRRGALRIARKRRPSTAPGQPCLGQLARSPGEPTPTRQRREATWGHRFAPARSRHQPLPPCAPAAAGPAPQTSRGRGPRERQANAARPPHQRKTGMRAPLGKHAVPAATGVASWVWPACPASRQTPQRHEPRQHQSRPRRGQERTNRCPSPFPRQTPLPPRWELPRCPRETTVDGLRSLPLVRWERAERAPPGPAPESGAGGVPCSWAQCRSRREFGGGVMSGRRWSRV